MLHLTYFFTVIIIKFITSNKRLYNIQENIHMKGQYQKTVMSD